MKNIILAMASVITIFAAIVYIYSTYIMAEGMMMPLYFVTIFWLIIIALFYFAVKNQA